MFYSFKYKSLENLLLNLLLFRLPNDSVGKESACNAGDPRLIPGSGRSPGEELGYPLQCSWASLVAQMVKNPPAMQETRVQFPGLGRSPGEGIGYPLQCSWASLVAQMVKNLLVMWETWVRSLGWEDFDTEYGTPLQIFQYSCLENPMDRGAW